jgi:hypothetical protein
VKTAAIVQNNTKIYLECSGGSKKTNLQAFEVVRGNLMVDFGESALLTDSCD